MWYYIQKVYKNRIKFITTDLLGAIKKSWHATYIYQ